MLAIIVTEVRVLCEVRTEVEETIEPQACDNNVAQPDVSTPSTEAEETIFATESICCV